MKKKSPIICVAGPTAVGKSAVGLIVAEKIQGEILSCDSMQVYEEVRIVSNKPTGEEMARVPHHLIDVVSVYENFDAAQFNALALNAIRDIRQRERVPVIIGGSGMYLQVLLDGIFPSGAKDDALRAKLRQQAAEQGAGDLHEELSRRDPVAASRIHVNDVKRIIRALEVCLIEGRPISDLQKARKGIWGQYDIKVYGIDMNRELLYETIDRRVDEMFARGIVEEIKALDFCRLSFTASGLIGVPEIRGYLEGQYDEQQAKALMKQNTRRLAKRQMTWFRREKRIQWLHRNDYPSADRSAEVIIKDVHRLS